MFTQKINYIWVLNLIVFITVVFLGIDQAGKGAEIALLERKLEQVSVAKRELSENIFGSGADDRYLNPESLGFSKPATVLYFNSIETVASIK